MSLEARKSFLVLFYKKEQFFFFVKKKQKTFVHLGVVYSAKLRVVKADSMAARRGRMSAGKWAWVGM